MSVLSGAALSLAALLLITATGVRHERLGLYPADQPADNVGSAERIDLGRRFFLDPSLSLSGRLSCSGCHQPQHGFSDPHPFSRPDGQPVHRRNASSLINVAYRRSVGWEGQSRSLEQQVVLSFGPYGDMGISIGDAMTRVSTNPLYVRGCRAAYASAVNVSCLSRAIAAFERSITSSGSRFDRFLFGGETAALSEKEKLGWTIFSGRGACIDCHDVFHPSVNPLGGAYATFSDERFHNLGVGYRNGVMSDTGRFEATRDPEDFGAFKTPMLRNVSRTAPYMHDGSFETLDDVIDFYNKGGIDNPNRSPGLKALYLTPEEHRALVAFLGTLDAEVDRPSGPVAN